MSPEVNHLSKVDFWDSLLIKPIENLFVIFSITKSDNLKKHKKF